MGNPYVGNALTFLISTAFGVYILLVLLRLLLQLVRADFYNPVSQFVVKATNPPLKPLRRHIPAIGRIDTASVLLMIALKLLELWITFALLGHSPQLSGLVVLSVAQLLSLCIHVFIFAILIQVVLSWVNPGAYNPVTVLIHTLTEPLLGPARRMLPATAGLDFSPFVVMVGLVLVSMLVVDPITDIGRGLL